jgi:hypothetical protein
MHHRLSFKWDQMAGLAEFVAGLELAQIRYSVNWDAWAVEVQW